MEFCILSRWTFAPNTQIYHLTVGIITCVLPLI